MKIKEFKAKIVDDFRNVYLVALAISEEMPLSRTKELYDDNDLKKLSDQVSGNIVIMQENYYGPNTTNDFFIKSDQNFPIYDICFERVDNSDNVNELSRIT